MSIHQLQLWHIARPPPRWVLHCILHSYRALRHSQDLQPDSAIIIRKQIKSYWDEKTLIVNRKFNPLP